MKKIGLAIPLMLSLYFVQAQSLLTEAQAKAKNEHKLILLNFSGSDWCIPCIKMQKNYFENEVFKSAADSSLIVIRADFPRKKKNLPGKDIIRENELLAERFNPQGSFPFTLLLDQDLHILKSWEGLPEEDVTAFTQNIRSLAPQDK
jgi:thiol-disulfide isomerase/thioredoxin